MANIDNLVKKFRAKFVLAPETENYKNNVVEPIVNKIFSEEFSEIFKTISESLNEKLGFNAVNFKTEGKTRFFVEGRFHRIIFQKGKTEILDNVITTTIIPLYIWKGVTKHLTPVSFVINPDSRHIKWGFPFNSPEEYAENIFGRFVEDDDFFM